MCEPTTLAITALTLSAIGTGVSAYAANQEVKAANKAAEYNAQIQERNAQIADIQAKDAEARGAVEEKQYRLKLQQLQGSQRAAAAGSGVLVDVGSPFDVLNDTVSYGELDALTIRRNAAVEAWGYRNQGVDYRQQANLSRSQKGSAALATTSTLLTGTSRLASQFTNFNLSGAI